MKKPIKNLRKARKEKKLKKQAAVVPRITNDNIADHREEILSGARKYIYPLQHSKHRIVILTTSLVVLVLVVFTFVTVTLLYRQQTTDPFMYQVTRVLPFPVARIGNTFVAYENYLFELRHYIHYYESQQELSFETEAGKAQLDSYKRRALDKVVNDAYIKQIAKEIGVSVEPAEIDEQIRIARDQNRLGSDDEIFENVLKEYWDWTVADFRRSLGTELLAQKVARTLDPETEARAKEALAKLETGADFAQIAAEYSSEEAGKTAGGDFGYVDKSSRNVFVSTQTVDTLFKLEQGQYSGISVVPYEAGYALEIVKNLEKKEDSSRGARILFKLKDLSDTINNRKEQQPYRLYITPPDVPEP